MTEAGSGSAVAAVSRTEPAEIVRRVSEPNIDLNLLNSSMPSYVNAPPGPSRVR